MSIVHCPRLQAAVGIEWEKCYGVVVQSGRCAMVWWCRVGGVQGVVVQSGRKTMVWWCRVGGVQWCGGEVRGVQWCGGAEWEKYYSVSL